MMSRFKKVEAAEKALAEVDGWVAEVADRGLYVSYVSYDCFKTKKTGENYEQRSLRPPDAFDVRLRELLAEAAPKMIATVREEYVACLRAAALEARAEIDALASGEPVASRAEPKPEMMPVE